MNERRQAMQGKTEEGGSDGAKQKLTLGADVEHTSFEGESHCQTTEDEGGGFFKGAPNGGGTAEGAPKEGCVGLNWISTRNKQDDRPDEQSQEHCHHLDEDGAPQVLIEQDIQYGAQELRLVWDFLIRVHRLCTLPEG